MTRSEAEEIFIGAIVSGKTTFVELSQKETQVFRVLIGRVMKDMEKMNRSLWLKARDYGVEWKDGVAMIRSMGANRYKVFREEEDGSIVPVTRPTEPEEVTVSKNDIAEEGEENGNESEGDQ